MSPPRPKASCRQGRGAGPGGALARQGLGGACPHHRLGDCTEYREAGGACLQPPPLQPGGAGG